MTQTRYDGTKSSAAELTGVLAMSGWQVLAQTPAAPRAATDFWLRARRIFGVATVEAGAPRDYRALASSPGGSGSATLVRVQEGGSLVIEAGKVYSSQPPGQPPAHGLSAWRSRATEQSHQVFTWDGSEISFSDLIAFFQLHGSLLNQLVPAPGPDGFPALHGTATLLAANQVYTFDMTRESAFLASGAAAITTLSHHDLRASYEQLSGDS